MINIRIISGNIEDCLADTYSLNEDKILLHDNTLVSSRGNYSLKDTLRENNIEFEEVIQCPECNKWTNDFTLIHNRRDDYYICADCLEKPDNSTTYFWCEDCQEWYDNTYRSFETASGNVVCEECRYEHYVECHDCGSLVYQDNAYYCDDCDNYFCESCWDDHTHEENLLYDYHEFNDWVPHYLPEEINENKPEFYIGHELEIDDGSDMEGAVETINSIDGICMHDGSLSYRGIEFISHPLSYKYMLSKEEEYRKTFEHLVNLGYKSHDTNTCGLHFHVTKPQNDKVIDRIILFMETYKEEIITLSRRKPEELNRWSRFLSDKRTSINSKIIKSLDYIVKNKDYCDRYMALNLTNNKTIEFRFFKGTLKYETFMADFEFINNLVHFASDLSLPVEELTWDKVTSVGRFLPQYIESENIHSDKPIIDYSKETLIEFNTKKAELKNELDVLIAKVLKTISNKARTKNNNSTKMKETINTIVIALENLKLLRQIAYTLETTDVFNYGALNNCKCDLDYYKGRMGK